MDEQRGLRRVSFTRARSVLAQDHYGALLLMIVVSIVAFGALGDLLWGRLASLGLVAAVVLMALKVSVVPRCWFRATALQLIVLLLLSLASLTGETGRGSRLIDQSILVLLLAIAPVAISLRVAHHEVVGFAAVAGAVCVYLLIGFLFASLYALVAAAEPGPFFVAQTSAKSVDYLYFSYITLTTVGYGDYTARGDLGRMLAVTEALLGQIYLVTVIALLVANVGRGRSRG